MGRSEVSSASFLSRATESEMGRGIFRKFDGEAVEFIRLLYF